MDESKDKPEKLRINILRRINLGINRRMNCLTRINLRINWKINWRINFLRRINPRIIWRKKIKMTNPMCG